MLHITWRHGTTPEDAIAAFFEGGSAGWDPRHARWQSTGDHHTVYWARHAHDGSVVVITCFERWED